MTREEYAKLTDEEKRLKISAILNRGEPFAEHMRWMLPDYINDLNAMHEAEADALIDEHEGTKWAYKNHLKDIRGASWGFATAAQRAEAFVLTMSD